MYKYFPHTEEDIILMLEKIGLEKTADLFKNIPNDALFKKELDIPSSMSEIELRAQIKKILSKNQVLKSFLGAGSYDVYCPSVIKSLLSRQEFLTSYTPYQAEISQGTLQYIFEFQSIVCQLTNLDVSNASVYDGATATAEAMFMATSHNKRKKVLLSKTINPNVIEVVKTYAKYKNLEIIIVEDDNYTISYHDLINKLDENVSCVIVQNPNYYGYIEKYDEIVSSVKNNNSLFIINSDLSTLSVLKTPGESGADIACGDAQTLGIPLSYGGPYLGYMATTSKLMRKLPGRIVGMTSDIEGNRGYVLTLQAREQHIRREKANSNICSNQSLMALHVLIYVSLMGKNGLESVFKRAYDNSHYLYEKLLETKLFTEVTNKQFCKEFVVRAQIDLIKFNECLLEHGYLGGLNLGNNLYLLCASEMRTKSEIDHFISLTEDKKFKHV